MKTFFISSLSTVAMIGFISVATVYAEDMKAPSHDISHKMMNEKTGMMGGMDMKQMMGLRHDCMTQISNEKMCDKQTIDKCQVSMNKRQCKNMMKRVKKQENIATK